MIRQLAIGLLGVAALSAAPGKQTFTGVVTDDMCARADHSRMRMGPTDAECVLACVDAHGAQYILYDGQSAYTLSAEPSPEKFAAQKVRVTGVLDAKTKTIAVESIVPAK